MMILPRPARVKRDCISLTFVVDYSYSPEAGCSHFKKRKDLHHEKLRRFKTPAARGGS